MVSHSDYFVPGSSEKVELYEKKSRFITALAPAKSRREALRFIHEIRLSHPGANHNCPAFIISSPFSPADIHSSDDGEPTGTAGKPMLNVLQHNRIGNVVVVVTRYFGGIKLGTGGLVRAYSKAVKMVLEQTDLVVFVPTIKSCVSIDYQFETNLRNLIQSISATIANVQYTEHVMFEILVPENWHEYFIEKVAEISGGSAVVNG